MSIGMPNMWLREDGLYVRDDENSPWRKYEKERDGELILGSPVQRMLTSEEHKERHEMLHRNLDELVADWIAHTRKVPSKSTVLELMEWAHEQTLNPTEEEPTE
jgi:hypothetical protein